MPNTIKNSVFKKAGNDEICSSLFDPVDQGFCVIEVIFDSSQNAVDWTFLETNPAFEQQTGMVGALGRRVRELIENHEQYWFEVYGKVALTGQSVRFEYRAAALARAFSVYAFRFGDAESRKVAVIFKDITAQNTAQTRSEFLEKLSKRLAPITAESEIIQIAVESLGPALNADRCYFVECLEKDNLIMVSQNWVRGETQSLEGQYSLYDFGGLEWWRQYSKGDFSVEDVMSDPLTQANAGTYAAIGVRSYAVQPFREDGEWTAVLGVTDSSPRQWSEEELNLVDDVMARVWPLVERARTEGELRKSEQRARHAAAEALDAAEANAKFRTFFEQGTNFAGVMRLDGTVLEANKHCLQACGFRRDEVIGKKLWDCGWWKPSSELAEMVRAGTALARNGHIFRKETPYFIADGSKRCVELTIAPVKDEEGRVLFIAPTGIDITERKWTEERDQFLLGFDESMRSLTEADETMCTATRMLGEYLTVDRCAYAEIEADEDTMNIVGDYTRGPEVASIVGQHRFADFGAEVLQLMRANEPYVVDDIDSHAPRPGDLRAYRSTQIQAVICVPLHKDERFVAAVAVHSTTPRRWRQKEIELTELVAARCWETIARGRVVRDLQESELRFRALVTTTSDAIYRMSADWSEMRRLEGGSFIVETQTANRDWITKYIHPDDEEVVRGAIAAAIHSKTPFQLEHRVRTADGNLGWTFSRAIPVFDKKGEIIEWFGAASDVTARKNAESAVRQAMDESARASRAKDEFLAALSHELRTPLTPVLMTTASLEGDLSLPGGVRDQLSMMRRNIELEARLIDDLLDLTRISRGKLQIAPATANLHLLLEHTAEIVRSDGLGTQVRLILALEAICHHAFADPVRLQQVFWNLIKNALKFTPAGGTITVSTRNDEESRIIISVADTGIGIAKEVLPRIFTAFEQGDIGAQHRYGGLGLGLAISQAIIQAHDGILCAESEGPGQGATFSVVMATVAEPVSSGQIQDPKPSMASALRLLVVEDHEATRTVLNRLLTRYGNHVTTAASVAEALAAFGSGTFDAVVSDLGLPDGSGLDLMREIQRTRPLPGIALSGYGMEEDVRRTREAGFSAHLVKPVNIDQLLLLLEQLVTSGKLT